MRCERTATGTDRTLYYMYGGLDENCADPEHARSDGAAAGSVTQPVAGVPHRPGKQRRGVRRYYTWEAPELSVARAPPEFEGSWLGV